jgi:hypothetical protein
MRMHTLSPRQGLLAGLLAFVLFASSAVAMTARGSGTAATAAAQAGAVQTPATALQTGGGRDGDRGDGGRRGDGDGR